MTVEDRFFKRVKKTESCWIWTGLAPNAYGNLRVEDGKFVKAHRFSYELHKGKIADGLCVLHKCDNPNCVNPDHLWLGTRTENNKDRASKGRNGRIHTQVLNAEQVKEIRASYVPYKTTQKQLASIYGISRSEVANITRGETWRNL